MQDSDIDRYIQESSKSFKECKIKNYARRSSLQRKTLGIDIERKLASAQLNREEKQLREQLRQMQIDKKKNSMIHDMREKAKGHKVIKEESKDSDLHLRIPIEPYPVTLNDSSPDSSPGIRRRAMTIEEKGRFYAQRRGRRVSKEFEDLTIDTETGKLKKPQNMAKRILSARSSRSSATSSPRHSPSNSKTQSPSLRKKLMESSDGSSSPVSSLEDLHWIGSPEATKSVRRSRKTIEEQELNSELHKLARKNKT